MEQFEVLKMRGHIRMVLGDADGNALKELNFFNLAVTQGRSWVLGQLNTVNQITAQSLSHIAIGSSTLAPTTSDTALNAEIVRNAIGTFVTSSLTVNPPSLQMLVSFATNQGNTTLAEVGIFNSNGGGTMFSHATYASFVKATSNTLNITYTVSD